MRRIWFAALAVAFAPVPVFACPVCGAGGTEDNWYAYLTMSAMLSLVPLAMIGGIGFWLYRRSKVKT